MAIENGFVFLRELPMMNGWFVGDALGNAYYVPEETFRKLGSIGPYELKEWDVIHVPADFSGDYILPILTPISPPPSFPDYLIAVKAETIRIKMRSFAIDDRHEIRCGCSPRQKTWVVANSQFMP